MASHPIEESYRGCVIKAHNNGYTISGAMTHEVDNRKRKVVSVVTGGFISSPGPSSDSLTFMQAAKLWIDAQIGSESGSLG